MMWLYKYVIIILFLNASGAQKDFRDKWNTVSARDNKDFKQELVHAVEEIEKIPVKIYYETLCPASVEFFVSQLEPVLKTIPSYIDVQLIPYGHATTRNTHGYYSFKCQHGPAECFGNKLHACVIHHVRDSTQAALLNICLMQNTYYQSQPSSAIFYANFYLCYLSSRFKFPAKEILRCANTRQGMVLLKSFGEATHQLRPEYVPYVLINGSTEKQDAAMQNLLETICQLLPPYTTHHCN